MSNEAQERICTRCKKVHIPRVRTDKKGYVHNEGWYTDMCQTCYIGKRRRLMKIKAVIYKGGKCQLCGYERCLAALDFHHVDPEHKQFEISGYGMKISWEKLRIELDKTALLCATCHREVEAGMVVLTSEWLKQQPTYV